MLSRLVNAFSVLNTDAEDDRDEFASAASVPSSSSPPSSVAVKDGSLGAHSGATSAQDLGVGSGKGKEKEKVLESKAGVGNAGKGGVEFLAEDCELPLVWIDLEMTGLDLEVDRILEIACIITDGKLTKFFEGPNLVIHQTKDCMDKMGEWCQEHHAASGLTERVMQSKITEQEAEKQIIEFVRKHVGTYTAHLTGNSVYVDFSFLKKYMPDLAGLFKHVLVDVSSIKVLCSRWFPRDFKKPLKENKHRALGDIRESIMELKYYKENFFKPHK